VEQAVQHILALLEEKDWPWTRVPLSSTSHHLQELLPRFVIKHCLDCYGTKISREDDSEADTYYELSVEKVCQFFAVLLLRQAGKVSQLVVLINRGRPGQCVSYYSSTTVSSWSRGCSLSLSVWRLISVS
jgi:hypothetical protein